MDYIEIFKALSNDTRLNILGWLREPEKNFPPQGGSLGEQLPGYFTALRFASFRAAWEMDILSQERRNDKKIIRIYRNEAVMSSQLFLKANISNKREMSN